MKRTFACDFETTVYEGQINTEVWSSALVELGTEDVLIHHSIQETFEYLESLSHDVVLYYHNLKFDGAFWLDWLMKHSGLNLAFEPFNKEWTKGEWIGDKEMPCGSYKYIISNMGQWYTITIKLKTGYTIVLRDSLKLFPFTLAEVGKAFNTKHRKLEMEYEGKRYSGCVITKEEEDYIKNDVLVLKEALEFMFSEGHKKLTIGACCLEEFKNMPCSKWADKEEYDNLYFPNLEEISLDEKLYGSDTVDRYIRNSYSGGWCYVVPEKTNKIIHNGHTADVNSLYPSVMHSSSGSVYPYGMPTFWKGDFIPNEAETTYYAICENRMGVQLNYKPNIGDTISWVSYDRKYTSKVVDFDINPRFYFVRFKCSFKIKEGKLPFIHIRHNLLYDSNENLTTSDIKDKDTGEYYTSFKLKNGDIITNIITMTMSQVEYKLFLEHYNVYDFEILDGCYFFAESGLFDPYINKWAEIKMKSKGAMRTLAKLFLNNLYGKMASNSDSTFKLAYEDEKGIHFRAISANDKAIGYIPIGSAITSYARNFTIRTAQKNFHGANERGFIYADTDSIHCDLDVDEFIDVPVHPTEFNHWKIENTWDKAIFVRQKTYIEHTTEEDLEPVDKPYYLVKCAGMPKHCKELFVHSMEQDFNNCPLTEDMYKEYNKLTEDGKKFVQEKRDLTSFKLGLKVPEKLMPKRIDGGVLLVNTTYEMR